MLKEALLIQLVKESDEGVLECDELNRSTISWSSRNTLVDFRGAHLVHPGSTVVDVAAEAVASLIPVTVNFNVETIVFHLSINLGASIPFSKLDSICMVLQNLHHQLLKSDLFVMIAEHLLELRLEDLMSLRGRLNVVLDTLKEEPRRVSGVESGVVALVVQVRD